MPKCRTKTDSKVIGYARVSTFEQDLTKQRHSILEWANREKLVVHEIIEVAVSSRKTPASRKIDVVLTKLAPGDTLVVAELSRLGRSIGEIIRLLDKLAHKQIHVVCLKENLNIRTDKMDIQTKIIVTLLGLFADIERDLISERTRAGLLAARSQGKILGRPKGKSKLDVHKDEIASLLEMGVMQKVIAKKLGCSEPTLTAWIQRHYDKRKMKLKSNLRLTM